MSRIFIYPLWLIVMFACTEGESNGDMTTLTRDSFPDQESWNSTIILTREGRKRAVIKSGHLAKYSDRQEVILDEKVDTDFFSIDEEHISNVKSDKALVFQSTDNLLAVGNVVVISDSGVTLFTDSLLWDSGGEKVTSNDTVMLTTESNDTLYGIGFESNVDLTHWKILKPWGVTAR